LEQIERKVARTGFGSSTNTVLDLVFQGWKIRGQAVQSPQGCLEEQSMFLTTGFSGIGTADQIQI
jgi:hypothetical protein